MSKEFLVLLILL